MAFKKLKKPYLILALAVLLFGVYLLASLVSEHLVTNYNFKGTHYDFVAFYTTAQETLRHGAAHISDSSVMIPQQRAIVPHPIGAIGWMPFFNPPFAAVFLAPLALMSINIARLVMLAANLGVLGFIIYQLVAPFKSQKRLLAVLLLIMTFPVYQTLVEGQLSLLVLFGPALSYMFFKRGRKAASGAALTFLWILPQFGLMAFIGALYRRQWALIKGWLIATALVVVATLPFTGLKIYLNYPKLLASVTGNHFIDLNTSAQLVWRGAINLSDGLNGFYTGLLGTNLTALTNVLYLATAAGLVSYVVWAAVKAGQKFSHEQAARLFIAAVLTGLLIDPHLFAQDAILIYVILPALYILYPKKKLEATILLAVLCNLMFIDQYSRLHFFTIGGFVAAVYYMRQTVKIKKAGL